VKPPRKQALHDLAGLLHELNDALRDATLHAALVDRLGEDGATYFLGLLDELEGLHLTGRTRRRGRGTLLSEELLARGRQALKECIGRPNQYFKRSGDILVPGSTFTREFCDRMQPTNTATCKAVLRRILSESLDSPNSLT
jgi:hypothetical protein